MRARGTTKRVFQGLVCERYLRLFSRRLCIGPNRTKTCRVYLLWAKHVARRRCFEHTGQAPKLGCRVKLCVWEMALSGRFLPQEVFDAVGARGDVNYIKSWLAQGGDPGSGLQEALTSDLNSMQQE